MAWLAIAAHIAMIWAVIWFLCMPWLVYRAITGIIAERRGGREND